MYFRQLPEVNLNLFVVVGFYVSANKLNFLQEIIGFSKFLQCIFVYQVKGFLDYVFESFKWQKNQGKCYMLVPYLSKESQRAPLGGSGDKLRFVKIRVACPIITRMYYVMMRCYIWSWDRLGIGYW